MMWTESFASERRGYGKPLGHKHGSNLTGYFKIKYKGIGIRVVYVLDRPGMIMYIIVVSKRDDDECLIEAENRYNKSTSLF